MIRNFFKIALRSFWKHKLFTLINISGLAIGISTALVIYLIVSYDFSFDRFEKDGDRIYRIVSDYSFSGDQFHAPGVQSAMPDAIKNKVTGLEMVVPIRLWHNDVAKISVNGDGNQLINFKNQDKIVFADQNYFHLLPYTWVQGSATSSLSRPYQVVLTEASARLYFPGLNAQQAIGRQLIFDDSIRTTVAGIVKNIEATTDFTFQTFISSATIGTKRLKPDIGREWIDAYPEMQLFVKLSAHQSIAHIQQQIDAVYKENHKDAPGTTAVHRLQPLYDLHFDTAYGNFNQRLAHKPTLYGLLAVAAFLLLLACINFINLSTAQSSQRAKEIGVRKTMGSSKGELVVQFLSETFVLTFLAATVAILLTPVLLKIFADFIPPGLSFNPVQQPGIIVFVLLLIVAVTILSGFYPAVMLSSYKPALVLKNAVNKTPGGQRQARLRKSLSVFQFVIAQVFIIATILANKQISYSLNKDMGFKKGAVIYFQVNWNDPVSGHKFLLMNKLKAIPEVNLISLSNNPPTSLSNRGNTISCYNGKNKLETHVQTKLADTNYIKLYHIKLMAGTNLPNSDTIKSVLINETCAQQLGFLQPSKAIGRIVDMDGKKLPVAGVIQDFHQGSFHEEIKPLVISSKRGDQLTFNISLQPQQAGGHTWQNAIAKINKSFKDVYPNDDFDYHFLDESIAKYYAADENVSRLLVWITGICIVISCLGLLGLVIYITNQRTKEIGIRKVIGATVSQIILLLSGDFLRLVFTSFLIAIPIAWYGSNKWLQNFAYKTALNWWIFLAGGLCMFLITMIILGLKTFKVALMNPVKSLRSE